MGRSSRLQFAVEAVPNPGLGGDDLGLLGIDFDLLSKVLDEDAQVIDLVAVIGALYSLE